MAVLIQVALESGTTRLTCWVDGDRKVRVGNVITLKNSDEPARRWVVRTLSEPRPATTIHTDWNVGGIASPRR